ncbi:YgaP family membrane protein [Psychrobacter sp. 1U2]|uniref:YgaP family membrane protein n=1 Tax=Psychrobacter sp. 1U2 TaxID=3453577 RepID=UPI003F460924
MKINVGRTDRTIRIIAGVVIIALGFYYQSLWGIIGLIPLLTGLFRSCVLYSLLGINTCKV